MTIDIEESMTLVAPKKFWEIFLGILGKIPSNYIWDTKKVSEEEKEIFIKFYRTLEKKIGLPEPDLSEPEQFDE